MPVWRLDRGATGRAAWRPYRPRRRGARWGQVGGMNTSRSGKRLTSRRGSKPRSGQCGGDQRHDGAAGAEALCSGTPRDPCASRGRRAHGGEPCAWPAGNSSGTTEEFVTAGAPRLVGREEEGGLLRRRWEQSQGRVAGRWCCISGEAGIGKSRLVEGLRVQVRGRGLAAYGLSLFALSPPTAPSIP